MSDSKSYWTKRRKIRANVEKHLQSIISYAASKNQNSEAILDNNDDDDVVMSTEHQHSSPFVPSDIHREITSTYGHEVLDRKYGQILTILEEIRTEQRQVTAELKKALAKMASGNDTDSEELELPEDMVLPVPSMDALLTLEERLGEQSCEKALVSRLGMIGGSDTQQTVRRILKDVLSHTVSLQLNWTGKGGKTAFAGLRLKDVLSKAVKRNPVTAEATEHEIEKAAKGWLRGATDRNGGWNKRRKPLE